MHRVNNMLICIVLILCNYRYLLLIKNDLRISDLEFNCE